METIDPNLGALPQENVRVQKQPGTIIFNWKTLSVAVIEENLRFHFQFPAARKVVDWKQTGQIALLDTASIQWINIQRIETYQCLGNSVHISVRLADDTEAQIELTFPLDQACTLRVLPLQAERFSSVKMAFECQPDEQFFGGGERFTAMGMRGESIKFWVDDHSIAPSVNNTYFPVPFVLSNQGYGFWLRSTCMTSIDFAAATPDQIILEAQDPGLVLEVYLDADPFKIIDLHTQRSGRPIAVPRWNWGFWHVSLGGEQAVMAEAQRMRDLHIPCSALWVYDAFDPVGSVGWPINAMHHSGNYPDTRAMIRKLHDMGFKVQTYLFPYFYKVSPHFEDLEAKGYLMKRGDGSTYIFDMWSVEGNRGTKKPAAIFDFTNPAANLWWQELMKYIVSDLGYDGWMHDFSEYTPDEVIGFDGRGGKELHNAYPVLCQQATREGCDQAKPGVSFYARCGFTGSQNWLTAAWNGDQVVSWDPQVGYPCTITACLSLSISGMPYVGPDIGGYMGLLKEYPANCDSKELWIRWTQFSAFTPIMRDHLGDKPDHSVDLWTDEETIESLAFYSRLHTALTPYWEIWAQQATQTGAPIMRHLCLVEPENPLSYRRDDEYMIGENLLVAPVITDGARSRTVYFPEGVWVSYWDGTSYAGGKESTVPCPLAQIPLFVRDGSLIPTLTTPGDTLVETTAPGIESAKEDLEICLFLADASLKGHSKSGKSELNLADETRITAAWGTEGILFEINGPVVREYRLVYPAELQPYDARAEVRRDGSASEPIAEVDIQPETALASIRVRGQKFNLRITGRAA